MADGRARELTGRKVLVWVLAFFGVVIAVNVVMAALALTTFGGLETKNAYQAGLAFKNEIAAAYAQETRHWTVDATVAPKAGETGVEVVAKDRAGAPLAGYEVSVLFAHPADRRHDRSVTMNERSAGQYRGVVATAPGQWDIVIDIGRDGARMFRSRQRVELR